jgi:type IV secretory pathway TraG/TraD family ATPase VirD4
MDVTTGGLIYIGLDSQGKPDLTRLVSSSVLQRISVEAAQRTTGQNGTAIRPKFLIVDEANWVDRTIVQNLLSRARSAGISMVLCTQGPMDWIDRDGNDFAKLAQNTNIAMIMKQGEPEAAELCADYIGTVDYQKFTQRIDEGSFQGGGSLMERTEHIVTPNELRGLGTGEMIIRVSTPSVRTEWLRVEMRDPSVIHGAAPQNVTPRPEQKNRSRFEGRRPPEQTPPGGTNGLARPPLD